MQLSEGTFRYTPKPGTVPGDEDVYCGVCGDKTKADRGRHGPLSYAGAMGKIYHDYDCFICPNHSQPWHRQVVALRKEVKATSSGKLAKMLSEEMLEILAERVSTKPEAFQYPENRIEL